MDNEKVLDVIYTEIGRGHPFYLDGTANALKGKYSDHIKPNFNNVFELSHGMPFRLWRMIDILYRHGSQGGIRGALYGLIRRGNSPAGKSPMTSFLSRDIRRFVRKRNNPVLVAHPLLVPMLSDPTEVIYQHGEIAAPGFAMVKDASMVLVPLGETRDRFIASGIPGERIHVTGLCIEPELADDAGIDFIKRQARTKDKSFLVGAFYSSGAEPKKHIEKITAALESLDNAGQKAVVFCTAGGRLEKEIMNRLEARRFVPGKREERFHEAIAKSNILAVVYNDRKQIDEYTADLFHYYDYLAAPSHERSNWALGLGLPMFVLHPVIGPFSPLNRDFLSAKGVAEEIKDLRQAGRFANILNDLRSSGRLLEMSANGYDKYDLRGFERSADFIDDYLERTLRQ